MKITQQNLNYCCFSAQTFFFFCRNADTETIISMKVVIGLILSAKSNSDHNKNFFIIFLCEKELVLRTTVYYEGLDIQMFFLLRPIVKEKRKQDQKWGNLQSCNKHKENSVNETIYSKNPC